MSSQKRGSNWSYNEDVFLCNSWVSISEDGAVGINQAGDSFWSRVHMLFCQKANTTVRTREAVESRFKVINHQCSLSKGSLRKTFAAKTIFVNDNHNKAFKFDHVWHILQASPKWYQQYDTTLTLKQGEQMEKRREERYEAVKENADATTRLRHIDVVTMDLSQYSPRKQKWLKEQQNAILGYDQDAPSTDVATSASGDDYFPRFY
ncbi:unnamed protein product [Cuscuta europaea]|uniref:No apical meristem-associated C-terminal domain-containing protein n=1 Tax=Cuscuta europaea TaxID=41803 RepID=A0A9P0ZWT1_CUSEU|nr:unnamed protein product [Cuscuta europaea]